VAKSKEEECENANQEDGANIYKWVMGATVVATLGLIAFKLKLS
jgi:hypothetical protein